MSKKFTRTIEDFVCENCGYQVTGNGYTNHCPTCLWSKHVDIHPGDRAENCGGVMKPERVSMMKGEYKITHICQKCGEERVVKSVSGDDVSGFLANMVKYPR